MIQSTPLFDFPSQLWGTKETAMLRAYYSDATKLVKSPLAPDRSTAGLVWIDLLTPTAEEDAQV